MGSVTLSSILDDPSILRITMNPFADVPDWYCARHVVERCGRVWNNADSVLKPVPEHHKAVLRHDISGRTENVWCLSKTGVQIYFWHAAGCYHQNSSDVQPADALSVTTEDDTKTSSYAESLAAAKANPSPLTLILLLDELTHPAVICVHDYLDQPLPVVRYRGALQVLKLRQRLDADEKSQVDAYIDWLIDEEGAES